MSCDRSFGRLDILVNVVGGTFRAAFTDVSAKGRDALVRTNFTWVVDATQRAALAHESRRAGREHHHHHIHRGAPGRTRLRHLRGHEGGGDPPHPHPGRRARRGRASASTVWRPTSSPPPGSPALAGRAGSAGQRAAAAGDGTDPGDWLTIPLRRKGEVSRRGQLRAVPRLGAVVVHHGHDAAPGRRGTGGMSGWMEWPDDGFTARPPAWVLDRLEPPAP